MVDTVSSAVPKPEEVEHTTPTTFNNMKVFIAVSCFLAVASAGYQNNGYQQNAGPTGGYQGPLHVPVIGPNGVPQEPAAVIAARNEHLANFGGAPQPAPQQYHHQPQQQYQQPEPQYHQQQYQQPQYQPQPQQYQAQPQYHQAQPQHQVPQAILGPDGHPQDAPDVAAAKAAHFAAYAEANARNGVPHSAPAQAYNPAPAQYNAAPAQYNPAPVQHYNPAPAHYAPAPAQGHPQDTPEVAAARAAHFAAHAQAAAHAPAAQQQPHPQWS